MILHTLYCWQERFSLLAQHFGWPESSDEAGVSLGFALRHKELLESLKVMNYTMLEY